MATTYTDAQQLWPVSGGFNCSDILGTPVIANTTNSRVCGLQTNRTVAERCCGSATIQEYQCWLYCETDKGVSDWAECVSGNSTRGSEAWYPFCQSGLESNNTERLASSGFHSATPKYTWAVFALVIAFLFIGPSEATIIPSLNEGLAKRQSESGCTLTVDRNFTATMHGNQQVSSHFGCTTSSGGFCGVGINVETSLSENNRTVNDTSAAEPEYDAFFDALSNATAGRRFPAMSSVSLRRDVAIQSGTSVYMNWTPISFCFSGNATGCGDAVEAATNGSYFEACGPAFVDNGDEDSPIQGILQLAHLG